MATDLLDPPAAQRSYRAVRRTEGLGLVHCRCSARVGDRVVDEQHGAFSITAVERGAFTYRTRAGRGALRPGWLMLGNEGEGYACSHADGDDRGDDCLSLSLSAQRLDDALSALGAGQSRLGFARACLPPSPRVDALLRALRDDDGEGFALEETALAVLAEVRRADDAPPSPWTPRDDDRAHAAAKLMEARAAEALALDDVAQAVGLSAFHLLRVFQRCIGITPHQYLMRVRLLRAMALLRDTRRPVIDVAYDAGWADLSNFNRAFRRELRCSPREFRRGDRKLLAAD
jgi:AraC family transcriptional regulator